MPITAEEDSSKTVLEVYTVLQQRAFYPPFISNNTEHCSFKSGYVIQVDNDIM